MTVIINLMLNQYIPKFAYVDAQNFESYFYKSNNKYINFASLFTYLTRERKCTKVFVFVKSKTAQGKINALKRSGYEVILCECKNENGSYNIDTDLVITSVEEFFTTEKHRSEERRVGKEC